VHFFNALINPANYSGPSYRRFERKEAEKRSEEEENSSKTSRKLLLKKKQKNMENYLRLNISPFILLSSSFDYLFSSSQTGNPKKMRKKKCKKKKMAKFKNKTFFSLPFLIKINPKHFLVDN